MNPTQNAPVNIPTPANPTPANPNPVAQPVAQVAGAAPVVAAPVAAKPIAPKNLPLDPEFAQAIKDSFEIIGQTYDLSENQEVFDFIRKTLSERLSHVKPREVAAAAGKGATGKGQRKKVPYNLYISQRFAENKKAPTGQSTTDLMSKYSKEWNALTADQQKPYIEMAETQNAALFPDKVNKAKVLRPMSGYNLYLKKHSGWFKDNYPTLTSAERMSKVGEAWKQLTKAEQEVYKTEAVDMFNADQAKLGKPPVVPVAAKVVAPAPVNVPGKAVGPPPITV